MPSVVTQSSQSVSLWVHSLGPLSERNECIRLLWPFICLGYDKGSEMVFTPQATVASIKLRHCRGPCCMHLMSFLIHNYNSELQDKKKKDGWCDGWYLGLDKWQKKIKNKEEWRRIIFCSSEPQWLGKVGLVNVGSDSFFCCDNLFLYFFFKLCCINQMRTGMS